METIETELPLTPDKAQDVPTDSVQLLCFYFQMLCLAKSAVFGCPLRPQCQQTGIESQAGVRLIRG